MYVSKPARYIITNRTSIQLNRVFNFSKARLLPPVLFASFFVCLYHTAGNALSFARFVLIASTPDPGSGSYNLNETAIKMVAVLILAVVCFLLWISPRTGLVLSKTLALYKLGLLLVLGGWGIAARHNNDSTSTSTSTKSSTADWGWQGESNNAMEQIAAFIYIVYSYTGWENACYVLGEFDKEDRNWRNKIRYGALLAVFLVAFAYTILTLGYYQSCTYADIIRDVDESDLGIAKVFATRVLISQASITGMKVNIALCAFGNLVAVAYTSTKVKQAIALHHFLPFSTFLGSDDPFGTPGGSLVLHWIVSSTFIAATPSTSNGYAFIIGLLAYGQLAVGVCMGLGRYKLKKAIEKAKLLDTWEPWIPSNTINFSAGFTLCGVNFLLLIAAAWSSSKETGTTHRYLWPVVFLSFMAAGFLYWYVLQLLQGSLGEWLGWTWYVQRTDEESDLDKHRRLTRRDGTEYRYFHEVVKRGKAEKLKHWSLAVIGWLDVHL